jgi:hypothetical protein
MITIKHQQDDEIEETEACYIRLVTGGKDNWTTPSAFLSANTAIERIQATRNGETETEIAIRSGDDDLIVFTEDAQIRIDGRGRCANRDGNAILVGCTTIFYKITDGGTYDGYYQDSASGRIMKTLETNGVVREVDPETGETLERYRMDTYADDDSRIRVWLTEYGNYMLRQMLGFDTTYTEIKNTYQNESGATILYPVRQGQRKLDIKVETNLNGLEHLKAFFQQPELLLFYRSPTDAVEQFGKFQKTSDIQITSVSCSTDFGNNPFLWQIPAYTDTAYFYPIEEVASYYQTHTYQSGIYEFSVSLEEI